MGKASSSWTNQAFQTDCWGQQLWLLQMPETCQYWSHRNGEGRTEHLLLQPWMDMDTHTPSQGAVAPVTGKTRQIYVPGLLLLPGRWNQHRIWGVNRERLPAKARHSHDANSRLKMSKHTSSRMWLPASIRLWTIFLQPQWMQVQLEYSPTNPDKQW